MLYLCDDTAEVVLVTVCVGLRLSHTVITVLLRMFPSEPLAVAPFVFARVLRPPPVSHPNAVRSWNGCLMRTVLMWKQICCRNSRAAVETPVLQRAPLACFMCDYAAQSLTSYSNNNSSRRRTVNMRGE